jgi:hypothetical protein
MNLTYPICRPRDRQQPPALKLQQAVISSNSQIHDEVVFDSRQFDGFCDACGGLRRHKLMCPRDK